MRTLIGALPQDNKRLVGDDDLSITEFLSPHNKRTSTEDFKDTLATTAQYAAALGIKYTPVLANHVYKGVIYVLERTLKAMALGSLAIARFIKRRIENFRTYLNKLTALKSELLALIKDGVVKEIPDNILYTNAKVIDQIKIDRSTQMDRNAKVLLELLATYGIVMRAKVSSNITSTKMLISNIVKGIVTKPNVLMTDTVSFNGMTKGVINNYEPPIEDLDSFVYGKTLPGDVKLIAYSPRSGLDADALLEAYDQSKILLGAIDLDNINECPFITTKALVEYLDTLINICQISLNQHKNYDMVVKEKDSLKMNFRTYFDYLYESMDKISLKDSLASYLSVKVKFIDSTFIAGSMLLENYTLSYLNASSQYCKEMVRLSS